MRHISCLLSFILSLPTFAIQAETLKQTIDGLIAKTLPRAHIGIMVKDAQSGKIIYERNAHKLFSPASNIKLLTAAAALYYLGPNARYITALYKANHNIYITFSGSPSLTKDNFVQLLQTLRPLGITKISGNIVLDTTQFKPPYHDAGASFDDMGWYYNAPSTAVMLNGNAVTYDLISAKKLGRPIQIKPISTDKVLTIINEVHTVSHKDAKGHCDLHIEGSANNTLRLYGCLPQKKHPHRVQLAVPNPTLYAKQLIKKTLKEEHITLSGKIIEGRLPPNAKRLAFYQSDDLTKLITHMLEESDNLYADSLTKRLAHSLTGEGTSQQGAFAIKKILSEHSHMDMHQLDLRDGEGTRYNMVTPEQLVIFLTDIYQDEKMRPLFLSALPRMGTTGTLKDRMKDSPLANHVQAKTGSMHDISSLSGYLTTPTDQTIIFSIISNGIKGNPMNAKLLEEKILLAIYADINQDRAEQKSGGSITTHHASQG